MSAEPDQSDLYRRVTELTIDELIGLLGWRESTTGRLLARTICRPWAGQFARHAIAFDSLILAQGWSAASRITIQRYVHSLTLEITQPVPAEGPLLVTANHPLITDFMALAAAVGRDDLSILAYTRPFLETLPGLAGHMILMSHDPDARIHAIRQVIQQLQMGQAVLVFPAGTSEPDPGLMAGLPESLPGWQDSLARIIRHVPATRVLPALVSGVTWSRPAQLGMVRSRPTRFQRIRLGGTIQVMWQTVTGQRLTDVRVQLGRQLCGEALVQLDNDCAILDAIRSEMLCLLAALPGLEEPAAP